MSYDNWQKRLEIAKTIPTVTGRAQAVAALKINFSQPTIEDEGYYRKPVTEKQPNGRNKILGYVPVAYFLHNNVLVGTIGAGDAMRDMRDDEVFNEEIWSWVVANPIPYEFYQAVAEDGQPWPDEANWKQAEPRLGDNQPAPEEGAAPVDKRPLHEIDREAIDMAIKAAKAIQAVQSEADVSLADGGKNRIAEARLIAKRDGEAAYKPLYAQYKKLYDLWTGMVKLAETEETRLTGLILGFRERERKRIAEEQAKAAAAQREIDEANERAAQRAIARGEPEPDPAAVLEADEADHRVEAPPEVMPAPAPVVPTYGRRTTKAELKTFAVITDPVKVFEHFIADAELLQRLNKLATDAIRRGETVPGATSREGYE